MTDPQIRELLLRVRVDNRAAQEVVNRLERIELGIANVGARSRGIRGQLRDAFEQETRAQVFRARLSEIAAEFVKIKQETGDADQAMRRFLRQAATFDIGKSGARVVAGEVVARERRLAAREARLAPSEDVEGTFGRAFGGAERRAELQSLADIFRQLRNEGNSAKAVLPLIYEDLKRIGATDEEIGAVAVQVEKVNRQIREAQAAASRQPTFRQSFFASFAEAGRGDQIGQVVERFRAGAEAGQPIVALLQTAQRELRELGVEAGPSLDRLTKKLHEAAVGARELREAQRNAPTFEQQFQTAADAARKAQAIREQADAYRVLRESGLSAAAAEQQVSDNLKALGANEKEVQRVVAAIIRLEAELQKVAAAPPPKPSANFGQLLGQELRQQGRQESIQKVIADFKTARENGAGFIAALKEAEATLKRLGITGREELQAIIRQLVTADKQAKAFAASTKAAPTARQEFFGGFIDASRTDQINAQVEAYRQMRQAGIGAAEAQEQIITNLTRLGAGSEDFRRVGAAVQEVESGLIDAQAAGDRFEQGIAELGQRTELDLLAEKFVSMRDAGFSAEDAIFQIRTELELMGAAAQDVDRVVQQISQIQARQQRRSQGSFFGRQLGPFGRVGQELWLLPDIGPSTEIARSLRVIDFAVRGHERLAERLGSGARATSLMTASVIGFAAAAGLLLVVLASLESTLRAARTHFNNAISAQKAYYDAVASMTTEQVTARLEELDREISARRGQREELARTRERQPPLEPVGPVDLLSVGLARRAPALIALNDLNTEIAKLDEGIDKLNQEQVRLRQGLAANEFGTNDLNQATQRYNEVMAEQAVVMRQAEQEAQNFVRQASLAEFNQRVQQLFDNSTRLQNTIADLAAQGTDEARKQAESLQAELDSTQVSLATLLNFQPIVQQADAARVAIERANQAALHGLEQRRDLDIEFANLLRTGTTEALQERITALYEEHNVLTSLLPQFQALAQGSDEGKSALEAANIQLQAFPAALQNLTAALPLAARRAAEQLAAEQIVSQRDVDRQAQEFALTASEEQLNETLAATARQVQFFEGTIIALRQANTTSSHAAADAMESQLDLAIATLDATEATRAQIQVQDRMREQAEQFARVFDATVSRQIQMAELLRSGTVEAVDERTASLLDEQEALRANLPALQAQAATNAELAEKAREAEIRLGEIAMELQSISGIRLDVALRQWNEEVTDLNESLEKDISQILSRRDERIADLIERQAEQELAAREQRDEKLAELAEKEAEQRADLEEKHEDARTKIIEDAERKRREIERQYEFDRTTAIANRDAAALDQAERRRDLELEKLREDTQHRLDELEERSKKEQQQLEDNLDKQRRQIERDYQKRLEQARRQAEREIAQTRDKAEKEINLRRQAYQQELDDLRSALFAQYALHNQFWQAVIALGEAAVSNIANRQLLVPQSVQLSGGTPQQRYNQYQLSQAPLGRYHDGTNYVPRTGLYELERGEAVIPERYMRSGGGGGGLTIPIEIHGAQMTKRMVINVVDDTLEDRLTAAGWN